MSRAWRERSVLTGVLTVMLLATVMPFLWMLTTSVKTDAVIHAWPPQWIPREATWEHYTELFQRIRFARSLANSVAVALSVTAISVLLNALGGYVFAKFDFPMRGVLFGALLLTLMVPAQVTMIPVFLLLKSMGLLNTLPGLILPGAVTVFGIFLMRQSMLSIPDAYLESARLDGCRELRIFWSIALPLSRPAIAALAIFTFTAAWSDFMMPLIVVQRESMYTLPVALANLSGQHTAEWGLLMAGSAVVTLPIVLVFLALQRRFIEGITMSGLKG